MQRVLWIGMVMLFIAPWSAQAAVECRVEVDPSWKLYIVTKNGEMIKDVRYMTFDDAAQFRDFFVSTGECVRPKKIDRCDIVPNGKGHFLIMRDGLNLDPRGTFDSFKAAAKQAGRMAKHKLCEFNFKVAQKAYKQLAKNTQ